VDVIFRTKKLEKYYLAADQGRRAWGESVARKFIQRVDLFQEAANMYEIHRLPGLNCHPLKSKKAGQYAITLIEPWRLIFALFGDKAEIICVEEVNKHYGD